MKKINQKILHSTLNALHSQRGVSLVELVLVVAAVGFLALLVNNLPSSISSINKSRHISLARDVAGKQMEFLRRQSFENLSNGTETFSAPELNTLNGANALYEINDCPPEICTEGEEAREVKVRITWNESGDNKSVELMTIIGKGGLGQ